MSFHSKKANKPLSITELVKEATNLYRTKEYIIKQRISICNVEDGNTVMVSSRESRTQPALLTRLRTRLQFRANQQFFRQTFRTSLMHMWQVQEVFVLLRLLAVLTFSVRCMMSFLLKKTFRRHVKHTMRLSFLITVLTAVSMQVQSILFSFRVSRCQR